MVHAGVEGPIRHVHAMQILTLGVFPQRFVSVPLRQHPVTELVVCQFAANTERDDPMGLDGPCRCGLGTDVRFAERTMGFSKGGFA